MRLMIGHGTICRVHNWRIVARAKFDVDPLLLDGDARLLSFFVVPATTATTSTSVSRPATATSSRASSPSTGVASPSLAA